MDALIKTIQLNFLITNLHSKGLERSIGNMGVKNGTLFVVLNKVLAFQVKICHFGCLNNPTFLFGLYLNRTFKKNSIDLNHSL
jgi:hypothetical protein